MTRQFTDSSQVYLNLTNFAGWNTNKTLMTSVTRNLFSRSAWRINLNDRYRFARAFVDRSPISRPVFVVIVIIPIWCEWNKRKKKQVTMPQPKLALRQERTKNTSPWLKCVVKNANTSSIAFDFHRVQCDRNIISGRFR